MQLMCSAYSRQAVSSIDTIMMMTVCTLQHSMFARADSVVEVPGPILACIIAQSVYY